MVEDVIIFIQFRVFGNGELTSALEAWNQKSLTTMTAPY
jgi:hypothetical protein